MSESLNFLAIDASTERCSVALSIDGTLSSEHCDTPKSHAKVLLPMVDRLMGNAAASMAQLDAVLVGIGPGSFTGIRIGISVAQGLAYAAKQPLLGGTSLEMMAVAKQGPIAVGQNQECTIIPCLDARMGEVYWSVYQSSEGSVSEILAPRVTSPLALLEYVQQQTHSVQFVGLGHGWRLADFDELRRDSEKDNLEEDVLPHATALIDIWTQKFSTFPASSLPIIEPLYLRNEVTWEKRKRIRSESLD